MTVVGEGWGLTWIVITTLASAVALAAVIVGNGFLTMASRLAWSSRADRFRRDLSDPPAHRPVARGVGPAVAAATVAVVCPLHAPDASEARNNAALTAQRYAGRLERVFVASRARDPGLVAERATHGGDPRVAFIVAHDSEDATDKASSTIAGWRATTAPFVAFRDADVRLDPDILGRCVSLFDADNVAGVFVPALHVPSTGIQRLVTMVTSGDKVVTVRALEHLGHLRLMEGGLMFVRRSALDAAGSIEVLRETLADDLRIATVLTTAGFRVRAGRVIRHAQDACSAASVARQHHRWMRCQRIESPGLQVMQLGLHAVVAPVVAWALSPASWFPPFRLGASLLWRVCLTAAIERAHLRPHGLRLGWWVFARPLADLAHFAACVSAFLIPTVRWGERTYRFERRLPPARPVAAAPRDQP